jgi:hypothetical protein
MPPPGDVLPSRVPRSGQEKHQAASSAACSFLPLRVRIHWELNASRRGDQPSHSISNCAATSSSAGSRRPTRPVPWMVLTSVCGATVHLHRSLSQLVENFCGTMSWLEWSAWPKRSWNNGGIACVRVTQRNGCQNGCYVHWHLPIWQRRFPGGNLGYTSLTLFRRYFESRPS